MGVGEINVACSKSVELNIACVSVRIWRSYIFSGHVFVWIIYIVFKYHHVLVVNDILQQIKERAVKLPNIIWLG